jgi:hypothetical protein
MFIRFREAKAGGFQPKGVKAAIFCKGAVTIPSLPDMAEWSRFNDARLAMGPNLSLAHTARRYHRTGEAA